MRASYLSQDDSETETEQVFNSFEAYLNIGRHLLCLKDYKRALTYLDKAQEIEPNHVKCLLMRSTCNLHLTNNDKAISLAKRAYEMTKRDPHVILLLAEAYYRNGEFEMALKYFTNGRRIRSSMDVFTSGIHKCEEAIQNNCGGTEPKLMPDLDLTDYYSQAFPLKDPSSNSSIWDKKRDQDTWPKMMPPEILRKIFGKRYWELPYIQEIYDAEVYRHTCLEIYAKLLPTKVEVSSLTSR
ncbi:unnamed protein product [Rodentolepis nana]|uniref:Outer dynein arm-docking complex subunit 4 n=1 Tax=Rodentolepis nana TaxID=102285 RepID=A0A0R3TY30_RODNA|nr:unnamed protein product [Rodentolepis nana]